MADSRGGASADSVVTLGGIGGGRRGADETFVACGRSGGDVLGAISDGRFESSPAISLREGESSFDGEESEFASGGTFVELGSCPAVSVAEEDFDFDSPSLEEREGLCSRRRVEVSPGDVRGGREIRGFDRGTSPCLSFRVVAVAGFDVSSARLSSASRRAADDASVAGAPTDVPLSRSPAGASSAAGINTRCSHTGQRTRLPARVSGTFSTWPHAQRTFSGMTSSHQPGKAGRSSRRQSFSLFAKPATVNGSRSINSAPPLVSETALAR